MVDLQPLFFKLTMDVATSLLFENLYIASERASIKQLKMSSLPRTLTLHRKV